MRSAVTAMAVASLLVGSLAAVAGAQQTAPAPRDQRSQERRTTDANAISKGVKPGTAKASDIIGMTVENPNGDNLGKIEDLVLDRAGNRVAFVVFQPSSKLLSATNAAASTTGSTANPPAAAPGSAPPAARTDRADNNYRDRYFALPWRDFKESGKRLTLAVDANQVLQAPSFPKSQWPDLGDSKWAQAFAKDEGGAGSSGKADFVRAHDFLRKSVRNDQNQKLGSIDELVLDMNSGRVLYAVLAEGGVLGLGSKLFAIPLTAFHPTNDHKELLLAADKDRLKNAKGFDKRSWPTTASSGWDQRGGSARGENKS